MKGQEDVKRAMETLEVQRQKLQDLEEEFKRETKLLSTSMDPLTEELEQFTVKPYKKRYPFENFRPGLASLPTYGNRNY
ncbi:MAG: hypothetical protein SVV67_10775 [Bacillota bacterium]|nr:hypothetical protein [Bacillota bacterium]